MPLMDVTPTSPSNEEYFDKLNFHPVLSGSILRLLDIFTEGTKWTHTFNLGWGK